MFNIFNCGKTELKKRKEFRCVHYHDGLSHSECYNTHNGLTERIGFLDIETSNLSANWGFIFSYCIKDNDTGEIIKRVLSPREIKNGIYDKKLLQEFVVDCRKYQRLVGYYSSRFDIPFLRSRCVFHGLDFPVYKELRQTDLYDIIKKKFKFHSNRLEVVAQYFGIPAKKHKMVPSVWFKAMAGSAEALNWILVHNIEDVITTAILWDKVKAYANITKSSI